MISGFIFFRVEWNGRQCLEQTRADIDKNQEDNTKRLWQRAQDVHRWKCELERAIAAAAEEIDFMEEQRRRLKSASSVLMLPESIAGECLERRTGRLDPELVRDIVEEELIKELGLTAELRETFYRTLKVGKVEEISLVLITVELITRTPVGNHILSDCFI